MVDRVDIESTGFHEAEIGFLRMENGHVRLRLDNIAVDLDDEDRYQVELDFTGVARVTRDGEIVDGLHAEGDGSSVIQFDYAGNSAHLVVDWRHYKERRSDTRAYGFEFRSCEFRFKKQPAMDE